MRMSLRSYFYGLATDKGHGLTAGLIKLFLFILSLLYGLIIRMLVFYHSFRPCRLHCKVISVGNITWGGTGKTPLVELMAQCLKERGRKAAILSRGYKRKRTGYESMGDEPYMLQKNLRDTPVIVDANRIRAANRALKDYKVDTVILDDGFQQWKIKKDLEIVVIDAVNPFGNRRMIPRGILREPLSSLKRADVFVLTKTNFNPNIQPIKDCLGTINPRAQIFESMHKAVGLYEIGKAGKLLPADALKGNIVTLVSGIADPDSFENILTGLGIAIGLSFRFPDHYRYQKKDLEDIVKKSKEKNIGTIITTEKDAARIPVLAPEPGINFFVLKIRLAIVNNEKEFIDRI